MSADSTPAAGANPGAAAAAGGMSRTTARAIEWSIIALCLLSLIFVFQPAAPVLHATGMVLVVVAGLAFNLVPLCQARRPIASLVRVVVVILVILAVAIGIAMGTAVLYGDYLRATACPNEKPGSRNWERKLKCEKARWLICEQTGPDTKPAIAEWCGKLPE